MKKILLCLACLLVCGLATLFAGCNISINMPASSSTESSSVEESSSAHQHQFTDEWKHDENQHWLECSCGEIAALTEHKYDEHKYDDEQHWKECVCGKKSEVGAHKGVEWLITDTTHQERCSCGALRLSEAHTYGDWQTDKTYHWKECVCGQKSQVGAHERVEWLITDTTHQGRCICGAVSLSEAHTYGDWQTDDEQHWKECVCGKTAGYEDHNYILINTIQEPTYEEDGWGEYECSVCSEKREKSIPHLEGAVKNPYKLTVYNFTGGYGEEWMDSLIARYEEENADREFTVDGVTYVGVDIEVNYERSTMSSLANAGVQYDVWFQEQVNYYQLANTGKIFADMTDVMTSDNPYEPGVTLESKLSEYQKDFYKVDTDKDGAGDTYYGIPHYAGYVGLVYNKAYFEAGGWYFKKGYNASLLETSPKSCFTADLTNRTAGPDGKAGTEDDGLPTTYAEFYGLCEYISSMGIPAVTWNGKYRLDYLNWFLQAMTANHEGLEQMSLNYSFDGTAKNLISVDKDGNVTDLPDLEIDGPENGYELAKQAGKYYALSFLENLVDHRSTWLSAGVMDTTYEHTTAQDHFVVGQSAMLIDVCWWEMEADRIFQQLAQMGGATAFTRDDFAWMPLPCATQAEADARAARVAKGENPYTMLDTHNSLAFIGKDVSADVYALAKDFIQFAYTDESLAEFSIITNGAKAVKYTMTEEQQSQMSAYGRSLWNMREQADMVYSFSKSLFYQLNEGLIYNNNETFNSRYTEDGITVRSPSDEFKRGRSAVDYFNGLFWDQKYDWDYNITR